VLYGATHGTGILSTSLAQNTAVAVLDNSVTGFTTFGNVAVNAGSILVAPELLGDANADGTVDLTDLSVVLNNFGQASGAWTSGNFDGAVTIDLTDLSMVLNDFGQSFVGANVAISGQAATAAPEPAAVVILAGGMMASLGRRRRTARITA
jgi:hypothetical protein